jgi:sec-independent protein translocase protein TatC
VSSTGAGRRDPLRRMSFIAHLAELRDRLIRCALALLIACCAAYFAKDWLFDGLYRPLKEACPGLKLHVLAPTEAFFIYLRIAVFGGVVLASPILLYQIWAFIAPGLSAGERRIARPVIWVILLLFAAGVSFVYFMMLPPSLKVLLGMVSPHTEIDLRQSYYFDFVIGLCLAGGTLFELPVVISLLGYLGIVSPAWLWEKSAYALVVLLTLSAVITPTGDAFTMLALTLPLMLLYWLSIAFVWLIQRFNGNKDAPAGV